MANDQDEESLLPLSELHERPQTKHLTYDKSSTRTSSQTGVLVGIAMLLVFLFSIVYFVFVRSDDSGFELPLAAACDTISDGYQCDASLSHTWGQYSPYYVVPSEISSSVPAGCKVTFVQLLSRHGARYPTAEKSANYNETLTKLQSAATNLTGSYEFLKHFRYVLGADDLTAFGKQQLVNSGIDLFTRYEELAEKSRPFIRASDQDRVVESSKMWSEGFHKAKIASGATEDSPFPYPIIEISEAEGKNNTLSHGLCQSFEAATTGRDAQQEFGSIFLPNITSRLKLGLGLAKLEDTDTIVLMDMCPYTFVAESDFPKSNPLASRSVGTSPSTNPFCMLFTDEEWAHYDYYQTLGKFYGYGPGSPLGPTQGIGFVNELIARLTSSPVQSHTSVNRTLDSDPATFPLDKAIYADFSHDNDMTSIFAALRLFDRTPKLSRREMMSEDDLRGYSASRTVPFGGRMVVEKLQCGADSEEIVRVIINGRVIPLDMCKGDNLGKCALSSFIENLDLDDSGEKWDACLKYIPSS